MKTAFTAALVATLVGLALPSHAQEFIDKRVYISPMVAYTFDEKDRQSEDGLGWYVGAGKTLNRYWNAEFGAFYSRFNDRASAPGQLWQEQGVKLDGQFFYSRERGFSPYFGIGAGVQRNTLLSSPRVHDTQPMVDAGLGFISWIDVAGYDLGLRMDARYRWAFLDKLSDAPFNLDQFNEPIIKFGLVLPVGAKAAVVAAATTAAATSGSKMLDADGDGVPDALDRCPGTARGVVVDANGCPRDTTQGGGSERQFDDVLFEFDRSELTVEGKNILDKAADVVNGGSFKSLRVNIAGHTDAIGSEGYNQALSERRANTVRSYLVKKGVDASRISTFAYGEASPKADNQSAEGRALNRRAEIKTGE